MRPNIYVKLFPCQLIILSRLFTFNVTFILKITDCTCVPQQILSQLILLWRPAWEIQWTSAWSWSTPKGETWPGSTTVSQKIKHQETLKSPVRLFDSMEPYVVNTFTLSFLSYCFFFCCCCRKLPLHDSLERHGQRHRCTDGGGRKNFQPRHLQCQLRGGQPPQRSLDEAHRQRFAGSQHSCATKKEKEKQTRYFAKPEAGFNIGDLLNPCLFTNQQHRPVAYLHRLRWTWTFTVLPCPCLINRDRQGSQWITCIMLSKLSCTQKNKTKQNTYSNSEVKAWDSFCGVGRFSSPQYKWPVSKYWNQWRNHRTLIKHNKNLFYLFRAWG